MIIFINLDFNLKIKKYVLKTKNLTKKYNYLESLLIILILI